MGRVSQPSGTVTLVFTDIEGSTRLLGELGVDGYRAALGEHRRAVREALRSFEGYEVDTAGDAFFYTFASAPHALAAVDLAMQALKDGPIRIRVGLHTGSPGLDGPSYIGLDVHKAARIMAAGHGGQVLLSRSTRELLDRSAPLRDLGEHRLKDFDQPEQLFQLGEAVFPPLKTISNTNLPRPASAFVGREPELAEVTALFETGARLVTLTGPGGTGKTRLAIEVASGLLDQFRGGLFWVELATLRDPKQVLPEVSRVLGARDGLVEHIGQRELLLVLDNLEQVIDAGPELAALVEACPELAVLVTSRARLGVRGEVEYEVMPLPDAHALALFSARSRLKPDPAIEELCRRLDNMPLALELAAARARTLTPSQIVERLGERLDLLTGGPDVDPRQRSLRTTIEWSYDLLEPEEQRLFGNLAVFVGGSTLEAAERVCDADVNTLGSLVEKGLLRQTADRYWMFETIRDYARELQAVSGEREALSARHAEWMLDLAERDDTLLMAIRDDDEANLVDKEHENGATALEYLLEVDPVSALRLAAALAIVWERRGRNPEGLPVLARAIAAAPHAPTALRAKAHFRAGLLLYSLDDLQGSRAHLEAALALFVSTGDAIGVVLSRTELGWLLVDRAELDEAESAAAAVLEEARVLADPTTLSYTCALAAAACIRRGDHQASRELLLESITLARRVGDPHGIIRALGGLGWNELVTGDYRRARQTLLDQLGRVSPGDKTGRLGTLNNIGWAELFLGEYADARSHFDAGLLLAWELRNARLAAEAAIGVAAIRAAEGDTARVALLWGASRGLLTEREIQPSLIELRAEEQWLDPLRSEYRADYDLGATLGFDETIELALSAR